MGLFSGAFIIVVVIPWGGGQFLSMQLYPKLEHYSSSNFYFHVSCESLRAKPMTLCVYPNSWVEDKKDSSCCSFFGGKKVFINAAVPKTSTS